MIVSFCASSQASAETRSLKLYFIHTKERAEIVYKRNGRYDQRGLDQINRFLRDWRRNEPAKMDPRLLDLVWEVYRSVGARDHIHVVSAYRSPATNAQLRKRSSGVAEKSQHTMGKAMDFYIPGVPLARLRAAAFKAHGGGVGYYPKSGAPFVHLDVGNVRSWPRMSRNELMALFPDGRTMHLPSDGKPLPGYNQALAAYQSRQRSGGSVQIASATASGSGSSARSGGGFLAALFRGGGGADEEEDTGMDSAPAATPARQQQPAAQPAPQRQAEPIIAALPTRNVPLPGAAPRPVVDIGAPAAAPLIAGLPSAPAAAPVDTALVAANVPLPTRRPDYTPPAEPAVQVAAAQSDLPVSAIAAERATAGGSQAITEMLAMSAAEARADVIINPPVPGLRPRLTGTDAANGQQVAAISGDEGTSVFALAALPSTASERPAATLPVERTVSLEAKERQIASLSASPRVAVLSRESGSDALAALDSGVRTTGKSAKPRAGEARPDPKTVVVPVQHELTRWAFIRDVTVSSAGGTGQPAAAYEVVWSAPRTVYTAGFRQGASTADANRFTGKAVTFMSVAKFGSN